MSFEKAKKYLQEKGYEDHIIELEDSSATVQLAAAGTWSRTWHDCEDIIFSGR